MMRDSEAESISQGQEQTLDWAQRFLLFLCLILFGFSFETKYHHTAQAPLGLELLPQPLGAVVIGGHHSPACLSLWVLWL